MSGTNTWKEALALEVFHWQVHARSQPSRRPGWEAAAAVAYEFFDATVGNQDLTLAPNVDGPAFRVSTVHATHGGKLAVHDVTPPAEHPWDLLHRLADRILHEEQAFQPRVAEWLREFDSPQFVIRLAAQAVRRIAADYACSHSETYETHGGGYDEPPYADLVCARCHTVVGEAG